MEILEFQRQIDDVSIALYQNREKDALEAIPEILQTLNAVIQRLEQTAMGANEQIKSYILLMYKELYEAYTQKDMLGIADCMQEKVLLVLELYKTNDIGRE